MQLGGGDRAPGRAQRDRANAPAPRNVEARDVGRRALTCDVSDCGEPRRPYPRLAGAEGRCAGAARGDRERARAAPPDSQRRVHRLTTRPDGNGVAHFLNAGQSGGSHPLRAGDPLPSQGLSSFSLSREKEALRLLGGLGQEPGGTRQRSAVFDMLARRRARDECIAVGTLSCSCLARRH